MHIVLSTHRLSIYKANLFDNFLFSVKIKMDSKYVRYSGSSIYGTSISVILAILGLIKYAIYCIIPQLLYVYSN